MQLTFGQFCAAVWRAWWAVLAMLVIAVGAAVAAVGLQVPVYQSTATVQVTANGPAGRATGGGDLAVLAHVDAITAVYAEAIQSERVGAAAQQRINGRLAEITARTFTGSPVIKVDAQSTSPQLAEASAQAVLDVVNEQATSGAYGYPGVSLLELQPPLTPTEPVSPRPVLTIAVAVLVGLGLGIAVALIMEAARRRRGEPGTRPALQPTRGGVAAVHPPVANPAREESWRVTPLISAHGEERRRLDEELDAALAPLDSALQRSRARAEQRSSMRIRRQQDDDRV